MTEVITITSKPNDVIDYCLLKEINRCDLLFDKHTIDLNINCWYKHFLKRKMYTDTWTKSGNTTFINTIDNQPGMLKVNCNMSITINEAFQLVSRLIPPRFQSRINEIKSIDNLVEVLKSLIIKDESNKSGAIITTMDAFDNMFFDLPLTDVSETKLKRLKTIKMYTKCTLPIWMITGSNGVFTDNIGNDKTPIICDCIIDSKEASIELVKLLKSNSIKISSINNMKPFLVVELYCEDYDSDLVSAIKKSYETLKAM